MSAQGDPHGPPGGADAERAARELLEECAAMLARRIRTLRQRDRDWSMRTSELVSSSVVRILGATDGGKTALTRGRFIGLLESVARSVVVDGIRRRVTRRKAQRILREQHAADPHAEPSPAEFAQTQALARELLAGLSEIDRAIVRLRVGGAEWREVADAVGVTPEAARQRWSALRQRLRSAAAGE